MDVRLATWLVPIIILLLVVAVRRGKSSGRSRPKRRRGGVGSGAVGAIYGFLNEDKQRAIDIIVEEKAEERRPEYPDGNLPDLEDPKRRQTGGLTPFDLHD